MSRPHYSKEAQAELVNAWDGFLGKSGTYVSPVSGFDATATHHTFKFNGVASVTEITANTTSELMLVKRRLIIDSQQFKNGERLEGVHHYLGDHERMYRGQPGQWAWEELFRSLSEKMDEIMRKV